MVTGIAELACTLAPVPSFYATSMLVAGRVNSMLEAVPTVDKPLDRGVGGQHARKYVRGRLTVSHCRS